jgi:3',5'-cyclic AMP phosphodiesterase CpdA
MRFAFITDLHFGKLSGGAEAALLSDLRAQSLDAVWVGGDVTQRAFGWQFRQGRAFLDALPCPWVSVIGNHDVPAFDLISRFLNPYGLYQKIITPDLNPEAVFGDVAILGLNSARRMMRDWAWEQGSIALWQIARMADFAARHADKTKVLMLHHPIVHPTEKHCHMLVEHADAVRHAAENHGFQLVLTGHLHRAELQTLPGGLRVLLGGTAICNRLRGEPNRYWIIEIEKGQMAFTLRDLCPDTLTFKGSEHV